MSKFKANPDDLKGYKIKIYPTEDQKIVIDKTINMYRAVYNIALSIQNENHESGNSYIKYFDMCKIFSDMRNNNPDYIWMKDIQISIIRQALRDLDNAFINFFDKRSRYPRFKSKKHSKKFFTTRSERTNSHSSSIRIPGVGYINAKNNPIPVDVRLYNTGVSFDGYDYWFYCQIEQRSHRCIDPIIPNGVKAIGVDVGIRNMITTSNGKYYHLPDTFKLQKRLRRNQRRLQRYYNRYLAESMLTKTKYEDIPKSSNMMKALEINFKTQQKIKNKNRNEIHCATKEIVEQFPSCIVIENISSTKQIQGNNWIRKYTPSMMYYEIHRQLIYKAANRGIDILIADSEFPSSQLCSNCGHRHKIYGNHRFICPNCGLKIDRDLNASINLEKLAYLENAYVA